MNTANNETLATIRMFGPLGKTFGRTHQRLVRTTHEAFRALAVTIPGFEKYMNTSRARGLTYAIYVGKKNIGADDLEFPNNGREIHIVPVVIGSKKAGVRTARLLERPRVRSFQRRARLSALSRQIERPGAQCSSLGEQTYGR